MTQMNIGQSERNDSDSLVFNSRKADSTQASSNDELIDADDDEKRHHPHRHHEVVSKTNLADNYANLHQHLSANNNKRHPRLNGVGGDQQNNNSSTTTTTSSSTTSSPPPPPFAFQQLKTSHGRLKQFFILILFIVGLIICVTSIVCILLLPTFVSNQIAKRLVLKNNSMLLERWSKPNVPMYFKVWIFDIKNARELLESPKTKPQLEEIGPFVFNLRRQKDVISFAGDNLYYTEKKVYHFNRELSCCTINRTVTIPNIPLVAVVDRALSYNLPLVGRFIPRLINRAIQSLREQLFVQKQVGEILFDGYEVDLLKMVSRIGSLVGLPQQSQRFALLKGRNDTWRPEQDGVWAINTGSRDRRQFGRVSSWNSYRQLPFWSGAQCNMINGSDGTLFPPPIKSSEPLYIFNQELCRTVNLIYDRPSDVRSIKAYRYVLNPLNFAHTVAPSPSSSSASAAVAANGPPSILARPTTPPVMPLVINSNNQPPALSAADAMPRPPARPQPAAVAFEHAPQHNQHHQQHNSVNNKPVSVIGRQSPSGDDEPRRRRMRSKRSDDSAPPQVTATTAADSASEGTTATTGQQQQQLKNQKKFVQAAQQIQFDTENKQATTTKNPHTCFCDRKSTNLRGVNVCEFDGLIDLSKCSKQAQVIFGSMPHFNNGDPRLLRQVDGMQPNASKHTTYLDIEPNTGLVLGGKRRVQLNLLIKHNNQVDGFENINDMLVPLVWFEESAQIPEESARKFKSLYTDRIHLVNLTLISLLVASIVLLIIDARLLLTTHYWRQLKLTLVAAGGGGAAAAVQTAHDGGGGTGGINSNSNDASREKKRLFRRSAAATTTTPIVYKSQKMISNSVSSGETFGKSHSSTASSSANDLHSEDQQRRLRDQRNLRRMIRAQSLCAATGGGGGEEDDETDGNHTKRSDSPLLNSSTATTDSECSPASSPELRKWQPAAAAASNSNTNNSNGNNVSNLLIVNGRHRS